MYSLVALLAIPATTCFISAYALDDAEPAPVDRGLRGLGRGRALHAQLADLLHHQRRGRLGAAVAAAPTGRAAASCCATACSASAALLVLYLPWVPTTLYQAAHTGAPWADAPAFDSLLGVPGVLLGRMPQIVLLICAGAGLVALAADAAAERARPRRAVPGDPRRLHADARLALSQASPAWANRYLAVALPPFLLLAAGGLANARRLGIVGLVLVVIMWAQDAAPVEKSNVRAIAHAIGPSLAPGDLVISTQPETIPVLHYYLPRRAALRDADRRADRARRVGLARRRRAAGGDHAGEGPQAADRLAAAPARASCWWSRSRGRSTAGARRGRRSSGSAPRSGRSALSNDPRLKVAAIQPTNFTPPRPNPVQATVMVKTR